MSRRDWASSLLMSGERRRATRARAGSRWRPNCAATPGRRTSKSSNDRRERSGSPIVIRLTIPLSPEAAAFGIHSSIIWMRSGTALRTSNAE